MSKERETKPQLRSAPHHVRLPGFLVENEIGLGDVLKRVTSAVGVKPCGGCEKRAAGLNSWITFTRLSRRD